jgi:hypothetical protein
MPFPRPVAPEVVFTSAMLAVRLGPLNFRLAASTQLAHLFILEMIIHRFSTPKPAFALLTPNHLRA